MSLPRLFLPSLQSLRCLATSSTAACSAHVFRASYSSTSSSRRSLQTARVASSLDTEPPPPPPPPLPLPPLLPRGAGVVSTLTNPANETQHSGLPPPAPFIAPSPHIKPTQNAASAVSSETLSSSSSSLLPPPPISPGTAPVTRTKFRPRKAVMTLTMSAIQQLRSLLAQPEPKLIRVGVKNKGCSGLAYSLEYVDKPDKLDEEVVQGGVRVLIDSKALFSIIGSEMDWVEDKLSARFVFRNPNIKDQCGCGESFSVS